MVNPPFVMGSEEIISGTQAENDSLLEDVKRNYTQRNSDAKSERERD